MIKHVTDIKTAGNETETLSDREFLEQLAYRVESRLDHIDVQVHEISQFIEEHRPALARGLALMSAGTRLGAWRKPKDKD
jgi:hypothetical protein